MTKLRFTYMSLLVVGVAAVLALSATKSAGAEHGMPPPARGAPTTAAAAADCMSCHRTRGAISQ
ncbi:MAG TPA: hypothetical protein DEP84_09865, partial [Chloroflexi bacterium]|nr:hypothetical protein [Chloroflexota bacterium]